MRLWKTAVVAVTLAASCTCVAQVGSGTIFARLSIPVGITTDASGNILVTSDALTTTVLTTFDPRGATLAQMPFGNFFSIGAVGYLTTESSSGLVVNLLSDGTLMVLDVSSAQWVPLFDLRQLPTNSNEIFDVQTGKIGNMNGVIQPQLAQYGDIAVLTRGGTIDIFASGLSTVFPFVTRVRFVNGEFQSARVVVSSTGPGLFVNPNRVNMPRGVAVNHMGIVATSLPIFGPVSTIEGAADRAVAFSADFPDGGFAPIVALGGADLASRGMTTDGAGNFYVATGPTGTTLCAPSGHGLVRILITGAVECFPVGAVALNSSDVAISPDGGAAYVAVQDEGVVLHFPLR